MLRGSFFTSFTSLFSGKISFFDWAFNGACPGVVIKLGFKGLLGAVVTLTLLLFCSFLIETCNDSLNAKFFTGEIGSTTYE